MNLRELRISCGKTRKEIAKELKIPYSTYSNYELGIRKVNLEQVLQLANLFDVSAEEIITAQLISSSLNDQLNNQPKHRNSCKLK